MTRFHFSANCVKLALVALPGVPAAAQAQVRSQAPMAIRATPPTAVTATGPLVTRNKT